MVQRPFMLALQALAIAITSWLHLPCVAAFHAPHENVSTRTRSITQTQSLFHQPQFPSLAVRNNRHHFESPFTIAHATTNESESNDNEDEEEKELTPETIAEMIEVAFLQSCLQLSQGYIDVLKLFIVAVKAGYERGLPLSELHQLVKDCPVNSAGRDLMKEELELRFEWMRVVYELSNSLNPDSAIDSSTGAEEDEAANARISKVVEAMLEIQNEVQNEDDTTGGKQDATVTLNNLTVEQALERSDSLSKLSDSTTDPMEKAFLTNDIRVALVTFRVLEEEKVCMQDSAGRTVSGSGGGSGTPRPSIPGT